MSIPRGSQETEVRMIQAACNALGADHEMTCLVLASYRHDPGALDALIARGGHLQEYVETKLALWESILGEK